MKYKVYLKELAKIDKIILLIIALLALINLFVQYSANDRIISRLINDVFYLIISFIILFIVASFNLTHLKSIAKPLFIFTVCLLIIVLLIGISKHGAKRWLNIGFRFQPSELCKLSIPLILAYFFSIKNGIKFWDYIIGFLLLLIPFLLIAKQPDLGTAILVFTSGFYIIFLAGLSWRFILISLIILIAISPIAWHFLASYQQHRILTLINPESDPLGKGYHILQGIIAIGSGGLWGKGYLNGSQIHLDFIPEKHTDFVITVIAEEFGYAGVCIVLVLYLVIVIRGIIIMQKSTDLFAKLLAGSITLSLMTYVLINIGMVGGIFPVVGVPLPLISYGGTATVVIMINLGMLLCISKQYKY